MKPDQFLKLAALGLTTDQIAGVMEIMSEGDEARREKGRARWHKWNDQRKLSLANVSQQQPTTANDLREGATRVEDNLQTKKISGQEEKKEVAPSSRGTRLPADWQPDIEFARSLGLSDSQAENEATKFREWWPAQPGQKGVKTDWGLTWKTWCRKAASSRATAPPRAASPPSKPTAANIWTAAAKDAGLLNDSSDPTARRVDPRHAGRQIEGADIARQIAGGRG